MSKKLKMPVSTIRYFCKQSYSHFAMTGRTVPMNYRTVHKCEQGFPIMLGIELDVQNGLAYAMWRDGQAIVGQEIAIAKSWGF